MDIIKNKRKIIDLANQKQIHLDAASTALDAKNHETYNAEMEKVRNISKEITDLQALVTEAEAAVIAKPEDPQEAKDKISERVNALQNKKPIQLDAMEIRRALRNSTTLATGTLVAPTGAGTEVREGDKSVISSIVNQVRVADLTGLSSFEEPYVISPLAAQGGKVTTTAGTARTESDPTFGVAVIKPYELTTTSYVDRNISRLTTAAYYERILGMAMTELRRKCGNLIIAGDGQASHDMYGMTNAKNKAGANIFASHTYSAIDENLLDDLYYSYGTDAAIGTNGRLLLTKAKLKLLGKLRNSDKERVFRVHADPGNPNTGTIEDGGLLYPYSIIEEDALIYGDPLNYELGLFGAFTVRVMEETKGVERLLTILGDAMVGGNVIVDKGFVVATKSNG